MGNQQNRIKQLGRLRYIEPTNFSEKEEGTLSDRVNFPYEDYCMAIDLTIRQTNRYSCGWWDENGEVNEITYSSNNGTLSFLGGSKIGKEDEGYYTTKFTDVSMTNPEKNTSECLGITSIDIAYDSWWYPQVTIKFVDVRGGTVMLPAEKGYYDNNDKAATSSIYKAFFSFPYPMFVLKVKGFYGKGVTYNLALHNTSFDFDSNTGNFNITASFIGYKFGIYTDMPLTFIACAPFMDGGREYWANKIKSGEFRFRTKEGIYGQPMITIPELSYRLAVAVKNQRYIDVISESENKITLLDGKIDFLSTFINTIPFKNWLNSDYNTESVVLEGIEKNFCYNVYNNYTALSNFFMEDVKTFMTAVKTYDDLYDENFSSKFEIFNSIQQTFEDYVRQASKEYNGYKGMYIFPIMEEFQTAGNYGSEFAIVNNYFLDENKDYDGFYGKTMLEKYILPELARGVANTKYAEGEARYKYALGVKNILKINNTDYGYDIVTYYIKSWAKGIRGGDVWPKFYFIVAFDKRALTSLKEFYDYVANERENIIIEKERINEEYRKKHDETIESLLGFRPSIKNIYDLMFAHMDTFMHVFYNSTKIIKDQLDGITDRSYRAKITHNIIDGFTDTENVRIKQSNGTTVDNPNKRSKYLPPYTAYYTQEYDGVNCNKKLIWLGDVYKGELLDEYNFVNNLVYGARNYFEKVTHVEMLKNSLNEDSGFALNSFLADVGVSNYMVSDFIPNTIFDFMFKDVYGNPYKKIKDVIELGETEIRDNIEFILSIRIFLALQSGIPSNIAGGIEAINLFKSIGDNFSQGFMNYLTKTCQDSDEEAVSTGRMEEKEFIKRVITEGTIQPYNLGIAQLNKTYFRLEEIITNNPHRQYLTESNSDGKSGLGKEDWDYWDEMGGKKIVFNFHQGYKLDDEETEKYGGDKNKTYKMIPHFFTSIKDAQCKYTQGSDMFKDQTMFPTNWCTSLYNKDNLDTTTFVLNYDGDYVLNIYKSVELSVKNSLNYVNTDGVLYGNRTGNDFNGFLADNEYEFTHLETNVIDYKNMPYNILIENEEFGKYKSEEFGLYDIKTSNEKIKNRLLNKPYVKYTTFDYTFDEKNPGSIFNNSIYWEQNNIKAKACLFLMANQESYANFSNKNSRVLKNSLLREGAFYWYYDTFNQPEGVKFPEYVYKMKTDSNGKLVRDEGTKKEAFKSNDKERYVPFLQLHTIGVAGDSYIIEAFSVAAYDFKDGKNVGIEISMNGLTPSRVKVLKKLFEDWAEDETENGFKGNESELTNLDNYSMNFSTSTYLNKNHSIKDILLHAVADAAEDYSYKSEWYYFAYAECLVTRTESLSYKFKSSDDAKTINYTNGSWMYGYDDDNDGKLERYESRNYDNGLDVVYELRSNQNSPRSKRIEKLSKFLRNTFCNCYITFEVNESTDDVTYEDLVSNKELMKTDDEPYVRAGNFVNAYQNFRRQLYIIYKALLNQYDKKKDNSLYYDNLNVYKNAVNSYESRDLKLSTYMTLKNLYDKWLCFPYNGARKTWVLNRNGDSEFDNFIYVDSYYNDIGDHLLVNPTKVSQWLSTIVPSSDIGSTEGLMAYTGRTLYEFLTEVAQNVGANLFAVPQRFSATNDNSVREMFTPMPLYSNWDEDSTGYVFMYTYQPSQHLGDSSTSSVDMNGWSSEGDGVDLTDDEIVGSILGTNGNYYNIPAFGVTYGKQNQSIFKNIHLSTTSMAVTEASISSTLNIASKTSEGPREIPLYGQDLYRVYSNYSYNCSVETMGNMQIMPMMYFQLNNIPFWKGGYQIIRVHHSIVPGNITTTFEGVRINRHAIPMSDGAILLIPEHIEEPQNTTSQTTSTTTSTDLGEGRQSIPDNSFTYLNAGLTRNIIDTSGTYGGPTNYQNHGMIMLHDCEGNINSQLSFTAQFDGTNVTDKKPIIYIHPAHYYNHKTANSAKGCLPGCTGEHCWSLNVVEKMYNILKDCEYNDGTSYNVHKGRTNNTTSYSGKEVYELVGKYGSKKVISIVPHWNGGAGSRWEGIINSNGQTTRLDTIKLLECIAVEAAAVKSSASTYTNMPEGMMSGTIGINAFYGSASTDPGTMPNCAAALTENWYADYDNWKGKEWLDTDEAINIIAEMHARGIKRYIDSLWT